MQSLYFRRLFRFREIGRLMLLSTFDSGGVGCGGGMSHLMEAELPICLSAAIMQREIIKHPGSPNIIQRS